MTTQSHSTHFLLPAFTAAWVLVAPLLAADKQPAIELRYIAVSDAAESISRQLGADAASAILTTDPKHHSITLREEHPATAKVRALITSLDRKPEQVQLAITVTSKTPAKAGAPARDRVLSRPTIVGLPGKPMVLAFDHNGETLQIEIQPSVLKP